MAKAFFFHFLLNSRKQIIENILKNAADVNLLVSECCYKKLFTFVLLFAWRTVLPHVSLSVFPFYFSCRIDDL